MATLAPAVLTPLCCPVNCAQVQYIHVHEATNPQLYCIQNDHYSTNDASFLQVHVETNYDV